MTRQTTKRIVKDEFGLYNRYQSLVHEDPVNGPDDFAQFLVTNPFEVHTTQAIAERWTKQLIQIHILLVLENLNLRPFKPFYYIFLTDEKNYK